MPPILIVPGWGNSGPGHWQSIWAQALPSATRVEMPNWNAPVRAHWIEQLDRSIHVATSRAGEAPVVVGHSLGCLAAVHWAAATTRRTIAAALLVAPADVERPGRDVLRDFAPIPTAPLPFPSITVASDTDPYLTPDRARSLARAWRSRLVFVRGAGHVNVESGHGEWPDGLALLGQLLPPASTPATA